MDEFLISIDTGASANKVAYATEKGMKFMLTSPYCAEVDEATVQSRLGLMDEWPPHFEDSWVSDLDGTYLLGLSAEKFGGEVKDCDRKYEKSLYKILGLLAYITEIEDVVAPISLGVLLPFDEYATKDRLEKMLGQATSQGFQFCNQSQKLELKNVRIRPEGAGVFLSGLDKEISPHAYAASLVVGHRNASWLVTQNGKPQNHLCDTCDFGFRWVVSEVRKRTGYKGELRLAEQIYQKKNLPQDVLSSLDEVIPLYWTQLEAWIGQQQEATHVVASGGGAIFMRPFIEDTFGKNVSWANRLAKEISSFGIKDKGDIRRLTDCYGLLLSMKG